MIERRVFLTGVAALIASGAVRAQGARPKVIAYSNPDVERLGLFQVGLRDFGYVEGRDYRLEFFDGNRVPPEPEFQRVVALRPDVIVSGSSPSTLALARLAPGIPIITATMTAAAALDLVGPNFSRPQGNVTGTVSGSENNLTTKVLETAHELVPGAATVGVIAAAPMEASWRAAGEIVGKVRGFRVAVEVTVATSAAPQEARAADLDRMFAALVGQGVGVIVNTTAFSEGAEFARRSNVMRVPVLHSRPELAEEGGLIAYGLDTRIGYYRAAYFLDRLFRGARIVDLPLEQNTEARLVINLKTAREHGFDIPLLLLARADVVIE